MSLNKFEFVLMNKLRYIDDKSLIYVCLNNNYLISNIAIKELVRRNPVNILVDDQIILNVINKMSIDQIWEIVSNNIDSKLCILCYQKLKEILDYYDIIYNNELQKEKFKLLKFKPS